MCLLNVVLFFGITNMLCIPLYLKCEDRSQLNIVFWFCQSASIVLAGWIYFKNIPVEALVEALRPGEGYKLITA